jgi:hypothetical protein
MDRDPDPVDPNSLSQTYGTLVNLWASGVRDYHSLLSDYLTANSIVVAAIGFLLARQPPTLLFTLLGMILCVFGILMVLQMAIVLGRFSAQIALWEWQLRGSELHTSWTQPQLFISLQQYRDHHQSLADPQNDPPVLYPTWALRQHRQWWARREYSFPVFFGVAYVLFLVWSVIQIFW